MKRFILLFVLVLIFQSAQSQVVDTLDVVSKHELHDTFYEKHKKQKKVGFILLGSGLIAASVGVLIARNSGLEDPEFTSGALLYTAGILSTVSSIPVLIISGSNKRKAETYIQAGSQRLIGPSVSSTRVVSVGVKIDI